MDLLTYRQQNGNGAYARLAKRAGIHASYLSQLIGGYKSLTYDMAQKLIAASDDTLELKALMDANAEARRAREARKVAA